MYILLSTIILQSGNYNTTGKRLGARLHDRGRAPGGRAIDMKNHYRPSYKAEASCVGFSGKLESVAVAKHVKRK